MQPEQQQRIMGYFIEEAKDHLNTIEQGLLNLQSTIEDQEMVNELFRAAHSVKGGAAMLGLNSIQQVSHRLEDYFKILKESPVKVDQKLESLFLQVFDALQELVGQLQGPFGLTDETANATVAGVEHVFGELENHLNVLASSAVAAQSAGEHPVSTPSASSPARQDSAFILLFQNDIPLRLREMLQLFKLSELDAANRQQLQDLCRQLIGIGEQFALPDWCNLIEKAQAAIAHPENSYRTLAPIVIRDIKQAQELVLSGRADDIVPCAQLQALQPPAPVVETVEDDFADLLATADGADWLTEPQSDTVDDALFAGLEASEPAIELSDRFDTTPIGAEAIDQHGPEVGMAELNSLADLFEGEVPDLGSTWQEEEVLTEAATSASNSLDSAAFDESSDFSDLLFDEVEMGQEKASTSSQDALTDLFSDDSLMLEPEIVKDDRPLPSSSHDLNDLFADSDTAGISAATEAPTERDAAAVAFDDVFGDLNLNAEPDAEPTELNFESASDSDLPLSNLGAFFVGMEGEQDLALSEFQNSYEHAPVELNLDELDDFLGNEPDQQRSTLSMEPDPGAESLADPWEELNQPQMVQTPPSVDQPASSFIDEAIVPPSASPVDLGTDAFFGHDPLPEFIEELSDQDDLDFSSLLDSTTTQTSADFTPEPLVEELSDDGLDQSVLDQSIASLSIDEALPEDDLATTPLSDETNLAELGEPLAFDDPLLNQPTTAFQTDLSDPWSVDAPQPPTSSEASSAEAVNLDLTALDFDNVDAPALNADLDGRLDIDFSGFDANASAETNPLDASDDWLVLDPAVSAIDPVTALEDPFTSDLLVDEPSTIANADPLNESLEALPDLDAFFAASPSESLPSALDDLSETESFSMADAPDNVFDAFDEPAPFDENLNLSDDLLTFEVPSESPSDAMAADALSDDRLGLSALESLDDPSIAPTDDALAFGAYLPALDELTPASDLDLEAFGELPSEDWFASSNTENTTALPDFTATSGDEESLDFDDNLLGFADLDSVIAPPGDTVEDSLDFGDELFAPQTVGSAGIDADPSTEAGLNFDEALLGFDDTDRAVTPPPSTLEASLDFDDELFPQAPESASTDAVPFAEEGLVFNEDLLNLDDPNEQNGTAIEGSKFAELAADSSDGDAFSLEFDRSAFDALGFDSTVADTAAASPELFPDETADDDFLLAFDRPEALTNADFDLPQSDASMDAFTPTSGSNFDADFDWEATSVESEPLGTEFGNDLVDLDQLLGESSASETTDDFEPFDPLMDEGTSSEAVDELAFDHLLGEETDEFADLESFLGADSTAESDEFSGLEAFLDQETSVTNDLTDFDALLAETPDSDPSATGINVFGAAAGGMLAFGATTSSPLGDFADLESLLQDESLELADADASPTDAATTRASEFDDLDDLLKDAEEKMGGSPTVKIARSSVSAQNRRPTRPGKVFSEQTMRVPVKHLDNLSNLVGELVVNRNSLEEDQERLRQSLDNLLYQVQQLSDVGQRMQDLYERSLLESSLLASRQSHRSAFSAARPARESGVFAQAANATGIEYDPLEMDRFTGFHSLSQEMIELIVRVRESSSDIEFIVDETDQVTRMFRQVTTQLQEGLTRSRMVPFAQTADRLPRAVRDIAMKVGKQAELSVEGRETLIDKMILEQLYDPMTHLVNNAITHGIESPDVRRAAGKPPAGRITIRAFHQGNQTIISVSDDGAGIDLERVKVKAIEKGLITTAEAQGMTRLDLYDLLFHAGFSTKDQADDFSGRGVGMDVVRTSLSEIRGAINTDSTFGKGTTFTIRLPLTLSISKALCCISDRARIAFPMDGVEDMLDVPKERIQTNDEGQACIPWRDSLLPLRPLNDLLSYSRHLSRGNVYGGNQEDDIVSIVVLRSAGNFLALQVDQVLGEQEIVIKQLEGPIPKPVGVAGATVLGDGRIMPIADVLELIDLSMGRIRKDVGGSLWEQGGVSMVQEAPIAKTEPTVLIVDDSITVRELLSMTFNKVGYRVEQARDGQEAWEKLRAGLPCDIVFCDIEMPRMDGLELLSRIQKDPNLSHLPIAMLTSRGADRHRQMAVSFGASGYFTKPYLEEALLDAAQRMLKGEVLISNSNA